MKSKFYVLISIVLVVALTGCASMQVGMQFNGQDIAQQGNEVAHINGTVWGLYFLPIIPLIVGDTAKPLSMEGESKSIGITFLKDTCNVGECVNMVTKKAADSGASKTLDLQSSAKSVYMPPVFWIKYVQVSGNAVN